MCKSQGIIISETLIYNGFSVLCYTFYKSISCHWYYNFEDRLRLNQLLFFWGGVKNHTSNFLKYF